MVNLDRLMELLNARVNRMLTLAEAALPPAQFAAFRKFTLDEFGHRGLAKELLELADGRDE